MRILARETFVATTALAGTCLVPSGGKSLIRARHYQANNFDTPGCFDDTHVRGHRELAKSQEKLQLEMRRVCRNTGGMKNNQLLRDERIAACARPSKKVFQKLLQLLLRSVLHVDVGLPRIQDCRTTIGIRYLWINGAARNSLFPMGICEKRRVRRLRRHNGGYRKNGDIVGCDGQIAN